MTINDFQPDCLPLLIGSLPLGDHAEASRLVFDHTPEVPVWVQLPVYAEEGMVRQYLPGMPGLAFDNEKPFIDAVGDGFNDDLLRFYEEYMAVTEGDGDLLDSRFRLGEDTARGFYVLLERVPDLPRPPKALKGQVTGPITFATSVKNQNGRAIFYDEQLRDAAVKLLAMKARWQVRKLNALGRPVIIFFDEPALAGFGSSEFISISHEEVAACLSEVIAAVHAEGGMAGIHVCANADWSLILRSEVDIVNFDAYAYFDKFLLYGDDLRSYIGSGRSVAWGMVPTLETEAIEAETVDTLFDGWKARLDRVAALGIDPETVKAQSFITPSCGAGSLSLEHARKVLSLTRSLSERIRGRGE